MAFSLANESTEQLALLLEEAYTSIVRKIEEREMDKSEKQTPELSVW